MSPVRDPREPSESQQARWWREYQEHTRVQHQQGRRSMRVPLLCRLGFHQEITTTTWAEPDPGGRVLICLRCGRVRRPDAPPPGPRHKLR